LPVHIVKTLHFSLLFYLPHLIANFLLSPSQVKDFFF
jgi:hypothetical protein